MSFLKVSVLAILCAIFIVASSAGAADTTAPVINYFKVGGTSDTTGFINKDTLQNNLISLEVSDKTTGDLGLSEIGVNIYKINANDPSKYYQYWNSAASSWSFLPSNSSMNPENSAQSFALSFGLVWMTPYSYPLSIIKTAQDLNLNYLKVEGSYSPKSVDLGMKENETIYLQLFVQDKASLVASSTKFSRITDFTSPTISITPPSTNKKSSGSYYVNRAALINGFTGEASDIISGIRNVSLEVYVGSAKNYWSWNGTTWEKTETFYKLPATYDSTTKKWKFATNIVEMIKGLKDGDTYFVRTFATDKAGNLDYVSISFIYDNTPPTNPAVILSYNNGVPITHQSWINKTIKPSFIFQDGTDGATGSGIKSYDFGLARYNNLIEYGLAFLGAPKNYIIKKTIPYQKSDTNSPKVFIYNNLVYAVTTTEALPDGLYEVRIKASDEAGNAAAEANDTVFQFGIDTKAPDDFNLIGADIGAQNISLKWSASKDGASGIKQYNVSVYQGSTMIKTGTTPGAPTALYYSFELQKSNLSPGKYTWSVVAEDNAGNLKDATDNKKAGEFYYTDKSPIITISQPNKTYMNSAEIKKGFSATAKDGAGGSNISTVTYKIYAKQAAGLFWYWDGKKFDSFSTTNENQIPSAASVFPTAPGSYTYTYSIPADKFTENLKYHVVVSAADSSNNTASKSASFIYDGTKPSFAVTSPVLNAYFNSADLSAIAGTASDAGSGIKNNQVKIEVADPAGTTGTIYENGTAAVTAGNWSYQPNVASKLTEGQTYEINLVVEDQAENLVQKTISFIFDNAKPAITLNAPAEGSSFTNTQTGFSWTGSPALKSFDLYINGKKYASTEGKEYRQLLADGTYTWYVESTYKGKAIRSSSRTFKVAHLFNIIAPADKYESSASSIDFSWSTSPNWASYDLYIDGKLAKNYSGGKAAHTLADGTYTWYVAAKDSSGKVSATAPARTLYVNGSGPKISIKTNKKEDLKDNMVISPKEKLSIEITDENLVDTNSIKILIDNAEVKSTVSGQDTSGKAVSLSAQLSLPDGGHTIKVSAKDKVGKEGSVTYTGVKTYSGSVQVVGIPMNYPNPFKPGAGQSTTINYTLSDNAEIKIMLFDMAGRQVWQNTYAAGTAGGAVGENEVSWNGKTAGGETLGNGVYLYAITSGGKLLKRGEIAIND